jgi:hypothetical protein
MVNLILHNVLDLSFCKDSVSNITHQGRKKSAGRKSYNWPAERADDY